MSAASGKVVLITGASSGIGLACAQLLAKGGCRVFGASRSAPSGAPFEHVPMDVRDDGSVAGGVARVLERAGRVDAVVNSAGYGLAGAVEDTTAEEARAQLDTNVLGTLRVCRAVLPGMRERKDGAIVNIGSIGGLMGLPFQALYSASKFALEGLTEGLRQEVRPFGIRVTLIEPGDVATAITDNRVRAAASSQAGSPYQAAFRAAMDIVEREERRGVPAEAVAEVVARVLELRSPRVRYRVGRVSQTSSALLKAVLPSGMFENGVMAYYGLGK